MTGGLWDTWPGPSLEVGFSRTHTAVGESRLLSLMNHSFLFFRWSSVPWSRALGRGRGLLSCHTPPFIPLWAVSPCSAVCSLRFVHPADIHCARCWGHSSGPGIHGSCSSRGSHKRDTVFIISTVTMKTEGRGQRAVGKCLFN